MSTFGMNGARRVLKRFAGAAVAGVVLGWAIAGMDRALAQPADLLVGQSAALSGPTMGVVRERILGAQVYFDELNAHGGIGGRKILLKTLDDAGKPETTVNNARALIADPKVLVLFNFDGTASVERAVPLITEANIALVAPFTGAVGLRDPAHRQVFHVRAGYDREIQAAIMQAATVSMRELGVFHTTDRLGKDALAEITYALQAAGLKSVSTVGVAPGQPLDQAVKQFMQTKPPLILCGALSGVTASFVRAMREAGYGGLFVTFSNASSQAFVKALGDKSRGVSVTQVVPHPGNQGIAVVREFRQATKATEELTNSYAALEGYISAKVLAEGLRRAGNNPTRDKIVDALDHMGAINVGDFSVGYTPGDHRGSKFVEITIIDQRGKFLR